jgi:hypothetical protein
MQVVIEEWNAVATRAEKQKKKNKENDVLALISIAITTEIKSNHFYSAKKSLVME